MSDLDLACTIRLDLHLATAAGGERTLATFRSADGQELVRMVQRRAGVDQALGDWDTMRQNYLQGAPADGSVVVVEAIIAIGIAPPYQAGLSRSCRVGAVIERTGAHAVVVRIRRGKVDLFVDGVLADEDWPCGGLPAAPVPAAGLELRALSDAELGVTADYAGWSGGVPGHRIQHGHPPGRNRWAGDTMLFHDGERLHLLYLIDRRHHASRAGCGGHHIAHLSTRDLRTWEGHPLAVGLDQPWMTCGTGTVVRHDGRWHLIYGLHSSRTVMDATCGTTLPQPFAAIAGTPMGATSAVSDDGIHFRPTGELVHAAQNPSVFADPAGGFVMFAGYGAEGMYRSDDLRHWQAVDHFVVPFGAESPWRNSTECLCLLEWNGWHYLIGGRSGFWMSRSLAGPWWDQDAPESREVVEAMRRRFGADARNPRPAGPVAKPRWDIYDGQWVPMACALPDGRRILAGWLEDGGGWAGCLVLRELLQEADGTLGLRWLPELLPPLAAPEIPAWTTDGVAMPESGLVELQLVPENGPFGVILGSDDASQEQVELRFDPAAGTATWSRRRGDWRPETRIPTPSELCAEDRRSASPHWPWHGGDFAIEGVEHLDRPFTLRLLVTQDRKSGSVVIDAEIAGRRTMITRRRGVPMRRLRRFGEVAGPAPTLRCRLDG